MVVFLFQFKFFSVFHCSEENEHLRRAFTKICEVRGLSTSYLVQPFLQFFLFQPPYLLQIYFFSTQFFASNVSSDTNDSSSSVKYLFYSFPLPAQHSVFQEALTGHPGCLFHNGLPILIFCHSFDFWCICVVYFYPCLPTTRQNRDNVCFCSPLYTQY